MKSQSSTLLQDCWGTPEFFPSKTPRSNSQVRHFAKVGELLPNRDKATSYKDGFWQPRVGAIFFVTDDFSERNWTHWRKMKADLATAWEWYRDTVFNKQRASIHREDDQRDLIFRGRCFIHPEGDSAVVSDCWRFQIGALNKLYRSPPKGSKAYLSLSQVGFYFSIFWGGQCSKPLEIAEVFRADSTLKDIMKDLAKQSPWIVLPSVTGGCAENQDPWVTDHKLVIFSSRVGSWPV